MRKNKSGAKVVIADFIKTKKQGEGRVKKRREGKKRGEEQRKTEKEKNQRRNSEAEIYMEK